MANTHAVLEILVKRLRCKPGWAFDLRPGEDDHPELIITVPGRNSAFAYRINEGGDAELAVPPLTVQHHFPVPYATYGMRAWRRWIFECCRGVENHELGEWFRDGAERPFSPLHGPGELPYVVHEQRPAEDALTTQDGSIRDPYR